MLFHFTVVGDPEVFLFVFVFQFIILYGWIRVY